MRRPVFPNLEIPESVYGSPKVIFWLAVAGAWGILVSVVGAVRGVPRLWKRGMAEWRNRSVETDFYYEYRESGYRILNPVGLFHHTRTETVVAMKEIGEIPISYGWSGEGQVK